MRTALTTAALLTTVALVAAPAAAQAADQRADHRVVHTDATGDVRLIDVTGGGFDQTAAPTNTTSDVVSTVVDHRADELVVKVRVVDLQRKGDHSLVGDVRTTGGGRYELAVEYGTKVVDKRVDLRVDGASVSCRGLAWSTRTASDTVVASIPRACLGNPDWVRVGLGIVGAVGGADGYPADDSRTDGAIAQKSIGFGPRQPHA